MLAGHKWRDIGTGWSSRFRRNTCRRDILEKEKGSRRSVRCEMNKMRGDYPPKREINSTGISVLLSEDKKRRSIGPNVGSLFGFVAKAQNWTSYWARSFGVTPLLESAFFRCSRSVCRETEVGNFILYFISPSKFQEVKDSLQTLSPLLPQES